MCTVADLIQIQIEVPATGQRPLKKPTLESVLFLQVLVQPDAAASGAETALQADGGDPCTGDLRVLIGLHTADAYRAQALAILHDGHATFEHAVDVGG